MITLVDKGLSLSETKYLGHRRRFVSTGFGFGRKKEEGAESYPRFTTAEIQQISAVSCVWSFIPPLFRG